MALRLVMPVWVDLSLSDAAAGRGRRKAGIA